jgi:hypothetical protein
MSVPTLFDIAIAWALALLSCSTTWTILRLRSRIEQLEAFVRDSTSGVYLSPLVVIPGMDRLKMFEMTSLRPFLNCPICEEVMTLCYKMHFEHLIECHHATARDLDAECARLWPKEKEKKQNDDTKVGDLSGGADRWTRSRHRENQ